MLNSALVLLSEVVLSLYPSLIKLTDASVFLQTGLRMAVFAIGALVAGGATGHLPTGLLSSTSLYTGLLNLLHVGSSYTAFDLLAGGNAMSLFYTYPFMNLLGASLVLGEKFPLRSLPWLLVAFIGAVMVAQPSPTQWSALGVVAALVAAATETGIYLWFKSGGDERKEDAPWPKMAQMYGSSGILWAVIAAIALLAGWISASTFALGSRALPQIIGFNTLVGFLGYALRFYLIPKVSTVTFSAISFFGVISAYMFGWFLSGEIPTLVQGLGAVAIVVANAVILQSGEFI